MPQDLSWFIGFRVVKEVAPGNRHKAWAQATLERPVRPTAKVIQPMAPARRASESPTFYEPLKYVQVTLPYAIPFVEHNHDPSLEICPNGDVISIWFSTITEPGRESGLVVSKLRVSQNATSWDPAQLFWHTPNRMDNAPNMFYDKTLGKLIVVWGMSACATWGNLAVVQRMSADCGETWEDPTIIMPQHMLHHQPVNAFFRMANGALVFTADNTTLGSGGTSVHFSFDNGTTWSDDWNDNDEYILGIHGTMIEALNSSLVAYGRGNDINGYMAQSVSNDMGQSWTYGQSPFPGIHGGQRGTQIRLLEGSILFCSFASGAPAFTVPTSCGDPRNITGLYCAASADEGATWPYRRLVSENAQGVMREQLDGVQYIANDVQSEQNGYSVSRQGSDGTIHLITSRNHFRFNLAWLMSPAPC
jgi:sulfatase modifying factor 1